MGHRWTEKDYQNYLQRRMTEAYPPSAREVLLSEPVTDADTTETRLLQTVRRLAKQHSYICYHTHNSRRSEEGFPDVVLARPPGLTSQGRIIFAELKSAHGKLTEAQHLWLDILQHVAETIEVYCWYPADVPMIEEILSRK